MINKVILVGRLGRDAECANERHPIKFSIATNENFRDENEESGWRSETTWHNITLWSKPESKKYMLEKLLKGTIVYLEGQIKTSEWQTNEGENRRSNDVTAAFVKVMPASTGEKKEGFGPPSGSSQASSPAPSAPKQEVDDDLDNLPF